MKQSVLSNRFAENSESVPYGCLLALLSAWVVGIILNLNLVTKILGRWKNGNVKGTYAILPSLHKVSVKSYCFRLIWSLGSLKKIDDWN